MGQVRHPHLSQQTLKTNVRSRVDIAAATSAADRVLAAREDHDDEEFSTFDPTSGSDEYGDESEKGIAFDFRNVWFSYPTRPDVPVLKGLDLQVSCSVTSIDPAPARVD